MLSGYRAGLRCALVLADHFPWPRYGRHMGQRSDSEHPDGAPCGAYAAHMAADHPHGAGGPAADSQPDVLPHIFQLHPSRELSACGAGDGFPCQYLRFVELALCHPSGHNGSGALRHPLARQRRAKAEADTLCSDAPGVRTPIVPHGARLGRPQGTCGQTERGVLLRHHPAGGLHRFRHACG